MSSPGRNRGSSYTYREDDDGFEYVFIGRGKEEFRSSELKEYEE